MEHLDRTCLGPRATIREAMACINTARTEIALVVDGERRLLGTVTDGDVRRALLAGATLDSAVEVAMFRKPTTVGIGAGRAEVMDLLRARSLRHLPIVDGEGRLRGLHLLNEILGRVARPNWAVIVAGGLGTRLQPLTAEVPKPMLEVAGRPILERIVLHLVGYGVGRVFVAVRHLGEVIESHFGDGSRFGCRIEYLREDQPLGTAGCLSLLPAGAADPILVMNGDLVTQFDVARMLEHHRDGRFAATMGVRSHGVRIPYGVVTTEKEVVTGIEEKPEFRCMVNAGIYVVEPAVAAGMEKGIATTMPAVLEACIAAGRRVGVYPIEEEWVDVGAKDELKRARGLS